MQCLSYNLFMLYFVFAIGEERNRSFLFFAFILRSAPKACTFKLQISISKNILLRCVCAFPLYRYIFVFIQDYWNWDLK